MRLYSISRGVALLAVAAFARTAPARAQELSLFDGKQVTAVVYDSAGGVPIARAAQLLAHDLTRDHLERG